MNRGRKKTRCHFHQQLSPKIHEKCPNDDVCQLLSEKVELIKKNRLLNLVDLVGKEKNRKNYENVLDSVLENIGNDNINGWGFSTVNEIVKKKMLSENFSKFNLERTIIESPNDLLIEFEKKVGEVVGDYGVLMLNSSGSVVINSLQHLCRYVYFAKNGVQWNSNQELIMTPNSYLGFSYGCLGKTYLFKNYKFLPTVENVVKRMNFPLYEKRTNKSLSEAEKEVLKGIEECFKRNQVSMFLTEMLTAAGVFFYNEYLLKRVRELCSQYNVLFVVDEIMTGIRCGEWFLSTDIDPDIIVFGKAFQMSGALYNKQNVILKSFMDKYPHGLIDTTNSLLDVNIANALNVIKIVENNQLLENCRNLEKKMKEKFHKLSIRGLGTMLHVDWRCRRRIVGADEHGRVLLKIDITDYVVENEIESESFHQWVFPDNLPEELKKYFPSKRRRQEEETERKRRKTM